MRGPQTQRLWCRSFLNNGTYRPTVRHVYSFGCLSSSKQSLPPPRQAYRGDRLRRLARIEERAYILSTGLITPHEAEHRARKSCGFFAPAVFARSWPGVRVASVTMRCLYGTTKRPREREQAGRLRAVINTRSPVATHRSAQP